MRGNPEMLDGPAMDDIEVLRAELTHLKAKFEEEIGVLAIAGFIAWAGVLGLAAHAAGVAWLLRLLPKCDGPGPETAEESEYWDNP